MYKQYIICPWFPPCRSQRCWYGLVSAPRSWLTAVSQDDPENTFCNLKFLCISFDLILRYSLRYALNSSHGSKSRFFSDGLIPWERPLLISLAYCTTISAYTNGIYSKPNCCRIYRSKNDPSCYSALFGGGCKLVPLGSYTDKPWACSLFAASARISVSNSWRRFQILLRTQVGSTSTGICWWCVRCHPIFFWTLDLCSHQPESHSRKVAQDSSTFLQ